MNPSTLDRGTTVRLEAHVRNAAGELENPASITAEIIGPSGSSYSGPTSMTNSSTGVFLLDKQTQESDPTGMYEIIIRATSGGFTTLLRQDSFKLE